MSTVAGEGGPGSRCFGGPHPRYFITSRLQHTTTLHNSTAVHCISLQNNPPLDISILDFKTHHAKAVHFTSRLLHPVEATIW